MIRCFGSSRTLWTVALESGVLRELDVHFGAYVEVLMDGEGDLAVIGGLALVRN